jgi:hypothetical protein
MGSIVAASRSRCRVATTFSTRSRPWRCATSKACRRRSPTRRWPSSPGFSVGSRCAASCGTSRWSTTTATTRPSCARPCQPPAMPIRADASSRCFSRIATRACATISTTSSARWIPRTSSCSRRSMRPARHRSPGSTASTWRACCAHASPSARCCWCPPGTTSLLSQRLAPGDLALTLGAGSITRVSFALVEVLGTES